LGFGDLPLQQVVFVGDQGVVIAGENPGRRSGGMQKKPGQGTNQAVAKASGPQAEGLATCSLDRPHPATPRSPRQLHGSGRHTCGIGILPMMPGLEAQATFT